MSVEHALDDRYQPPCIEERTLIDAPLAQTASGARSAVFRPV